MAMLSYRLLLMTIAILCQCSSATGLFSIFSGLVNRRLGAVSTSLAPWKLVSLPPHENLVSNRLPDSTLTICRSSSFPAPSPSSSAPSSFSSSRHLLSAIPSSVSQDTTNCPRTFCRKLTTRLRRIMSGTNEGVPIGVGCRRGKRW